ncbi:MAG TPA: hypothetical protein VMB03_03060 [Bryobacteraceae bacterium]|nr:hypothetical protein [Bryobacteraceae bacterium]
MLSFRQFEAGPDPFGRKYQVYFRWLQTAISIRHSDTVDAQFILEDENGGQILKTVAMPHAALLALSHETGRKLDDPWCSRLAERHLLHMIETGEDMDKDLVTVPLADLRNYAAQLAKAA